MKKTTVFLFALLLASFTCIASPLPVSDRPIPSAHIAPVPKVSRFDRFKDGLTKSLDVYIWIDGVLEERVK